MNNYLQLLISATVVLIGILIVFFYSFFGKVNDSSRKAYQNTEELRRTEFSRTTQTLNYIYIALIVIFLLMVYFLVPQQKLR